MQGGLAYWMASLPLITDILQSSLASWPLCSHSTGALSGLADLKCLQLINVVSEFNVSILNISLDVSSIFITISVPLGIVILLRL